MFVWSKNIANNFKSGQTPTSSNGKTTPSAAALGDRTSPHVVTLNVRTYALNPEALRFSNHVNTDIRILYSYKPDRRSDWLLLLKVTVVEKLLQPCITCLINWIIWCKKILFFCPGPLGAVIEKLRRNFCKLWIDIFLLNYENWFFFNSIRDDFLYPVSYFFLEKKC